MQRTTAKMFYRLHNSISSPAIPENVGDFRLMGRKVVEALGGSEQLNSQQKEGTD